MNDEKIIVVSVAPITKTILDEDLTYFSTREVSPGSVVQVSLRNKDVLGVVTSIRNADELKSEIKSAKFGFKKIKQIISNGIYMTGFIRAAEETAEYFAYGSGQIIRALTPKTILDEWQKHQFNEESKTIQEAAKVENPISSRFEVSVLGLPDHERYSFYRSLIREEFAKKRSVFFILPTIHNVEECAEILKKGIENYTISMHGRLTAKKITEEWHRALQEDHPILIVSTATFLSLPRDDIGTIIIDKENSQFYKTASRPFFDIRIFTEMLAKNISAKLILGDSIPRIEDIYNAEIGNFVPESPLKYRFPKNIQQEVVDMRKMPEENLILSPMAITAIHESLSMKERSLVICARKGLGTSTTCSDCGDIIVCSKCTLPMILFRTSKENIFVCNKCGEQSSTDIKCGKCGGWRLKALGVGTDKVYDELKLKFPKANIYKIDNNSAKNYKEVRTILDNYFVDPAGILISTEMILNYLGVDIPTIVIASIDSLFSIPDFRINENIFNFLTRLRLRATKSFIIQSRKPKEKIFEHIMRGDLLEFYRGEISERKKFDYPPFKTLIKITAEGPKHKVQNEMNQLEKFLKNYGPNKFAAFIEQINNKDRINILLRVAPNEWPPHPSKTPEVNVELPYSNLLEILQSLPKRFIIKVEPDNIL